METLTRDELIVELAKDYGVRAKVLGLKFEEAYAKYVKRCSLRTYENLLQQFTIGNLSDPVKIKPKLRSACRHRSIESQNVECHASCC